ncbi:fimbria/pilus outer membrane usher protein [Gluconacetobacter sacchari]|uniref:fimbria/pilus outer membrane usher protein n=1 Tax=Gluconacetobacter sacchari TaxID=92759 RepID=UPI0039B5DC64
MLALTAVRDHGARAAALPPPPHSFGAATVDTGMTLYLDLVLNGLDTGRVEPVLAKGERFFLAAPALRALGLGAHLPNNEEGPVALATIAGLRTRYDSTAQKLLLSVPTHWLPAQHFAQDRLVEEKKARSSFGAILNYDAYATQATGLANLSLWNEQRIFGAFGTLSNTGVAQFGFEGTVGNGKNRASYRRYDTTWRYSDQNRVLTAEAGDIVTHALAWSSTIRLGGIQISRDFSVRPDIVTYPLPQFSGQASVPTSVDLLVNGVQSMHSTVQPGPYSLTDLPYINGAGEATVVTTDALGRRVETSVPFYVASTLLHPGYSDYTLALGAQRERYGLADFDYGAPSVNASYRRGLLPVLTLETHAEAAPHLLLGGLGLLAQIGQRFGVVNIAASASRRPGNRTTNARTTLPTDGQQFVAGYQYTHRNFTVAAQKTWRTRGYADLSTYDPGFTRLPLSSLQASASLMLKPFGSLSLGYFDITPSVGRRTRFATITDTLPLWHGISLSLSGNRQLGTLDARSDGWAGYAQIVIPFGAYGTATAGWSRRADGESTEQVTATRSVAARGDFGWTANYQHANGTGQAGGADYVEGSATWRGPFAQFQGGLYGDVRDTTRWAEAQGSIALLDGAAFFGNRVPDAFAVVSTDHVAGVPVRYENQLVGKTNAGGHLLVPYATSYYPAKYEIDTLSLPADLQARMVEQRVAVQYGSGYLVRFPMKHVLTVLIRLTDPSGKPLPVGTSVRAADTEAEADAYVGWDGMLYLNGISRGEKLEASLPSGDRCIATADAVPAASAGQVRLGPLVCRSVPTP